MAAARRIIIGSKDLTTTLGRVRLQSFLFSLSFNGLARQDVGVQAETLSDTDSATFSNPDEMPALNMSTARPDTCFKAQFHLI